MTRQDELNARVWAACEAFRGDMHFTLCRDHALALVFLKYVSDVWHNHQPQFAATATHGSVAKARFYLPRVDGMDPSAAREADLLWDGDIYGVPPKGSLPAAPGPDVFLADIYNLNIRRTAAHIGTLLTRTLATLEQHNQAALGGLFHHLVFHTDAVLGSGPEHHARLRHFLAELLDGPQLQQFDVVLTWPPQREGQWLSDKKRPDGWGRFQRGLPSARGAELAWLSHCLAITRPGCGRLAIITPKRMLYCGAPDGQIRRSLIEENLLDTVIYLPANVLPHTRQPMAVCLFDRSREPGGARAHARDVLLIDAGAGQEPNKRLCLPDASQIDEIIADVNARQTQGQRCYLASFDEIAANDFDLSMPRYLLARTRTPHKPRDLPRERQEIEQLGQTLLQLQNSLQQKIAAMGN